MGTLYGRLSVKEAIAPVVDEFVARYAGMGVTAGEYDALVETW